MVRLSDGQLGIIDGNIDRTWGKENYYCRSGAGLILSPTSQDYNGIHFYTYMPVSPGRYILSFWCWTSGVDLQPVLRCNLFNGNPYKDHYFRDLSIPANTPTRFEIPVTVDYTQTVMLRLLSWTKYTTGLMFVTDVKFERGDKATAWSPSPDDPIEALDAGGIVRISKQGIYMSGGVIDMRLNDGSQYLSITSEGVSGSEIHSPTVAPRYVGTQMWVNPNATSDQVARGYTFRSLTDALASISGRQIGTDVAVHIQGNSYGDAHLSGVWGGGSVIIWGNGCTNYGHLEISNVSSRVYVNNLNMVRGNSTVAAKQVGSVYVRWYQCTFNGNDSAHNNSGIRGLLIDEGGGAMVWDCSFYNAHVLMQFGHTVDVSCVGLRGGNSSYFAATDACRLTWAGTRPDGVWQQHNPSLIAPNADPSVQPIDYGSAQPTTPPTTEVSYALVNSDNYAGGTWSNYSDEDPRQGYTSGLGEIRGCLWFDNAAIRSALSGKTIKKASISLYQIPGIGRSSVEVKLEGITMNYSGRTGTPWGNPEYGTIGTASQGQVVTMTIPNKVITDLVAGTING